MKETQSLADEKVEISEKTLKLIGLHIKRLKETLSKLQNNPSSSTTETKSNILSPKTEETKVTDHAQKTARNHQHTHSNINLKNRKSSTMIKTSVSRKRRKIESTADTSNVADISNENHNKDVNANGEPLYCICRQISYGNMIACDNQKNCPHEWFHYECVGLVEPPKGSWYCPDCRKNMSKKKIEEESESEDDTSD